MGQSETSMRDVKQGRGEPSDGVAGLILAGGRGRRMDGLDKPFARLAGRPLIDHVIARVGEQTTRLAINMSGDASRFAAHDLPLIPDLTDGGRIEAFAGPLAGVLSGLDWMAAQGGGIEWVATFPADTPFLPVDFVERALAAIRREGAELACAASAGRVHPVVALWPVALRERLRRLIVDENLRRADRLLESFRTAQVAYGIDPIDPFFNINTPDDLALAEEVLGRL